MWEKKHFEYQEVGILQGRGLTEEKGGLASKWAVYVSVPFPFYALVERGFKICLSKIIHKLLLRAHSSSAFGSEDISICRNLMFQW